MTQLNFEITSTIFTGSLLRELDMKDITDKVNKINDAELLLGITECKIDKIYEVSDNGKIQYFAHIDNDLYRKLEKCENI